MDINGKFIHATINPTEVQNRAIEELQLRLALVQEQQNLLTKTQTLLDNYGAEKLQLMLGQASFLLSPEKKREEIMVHLEDLEEDITKPEKLKPQRIKIRIISLLTIIAMLFNLIAGAADFSNNLLELSEKLAVPIERNLIN